LTSISRRWLLAILLLSIILRVAVAFAFGDAITETRGGTFDQISYDALAQRVVGGHGFSFATDWWPGVRADQPTAFWSYLYTLFLAAIYVIFGHHPLAARLIQAVLVGLAMPWLTYRLAGRVFSGQGTGDRDQEARDDRNRGFSRFLALPSRPAKALSFTDNYLASIGLFCQTRCNWHLDGVFWLARSLTKDGI
jgi:hypothetical protein